MDLNYYQAQSAKTDMGTEVIDPKGVAYQGLHLAEYTGQVAGLIKKLFRDHGGDYSQLDQQGIYMQIVENCSVVLTSLWGQFFGEPVKDDKGLVYNTLGLVNEAGEVAQKVVIAFESGEIVEIDESLRQALKKELGDCLWYIAQLATALGLPLNQVAGANLEKLSSRQARGKVQGAGDER